MVRDIRRLDSGDVAGNGLKTEVILISSLSVEVPLAGVDALHVLPKLLPGTFETKPNAADSSKQIDKAGTHRLALSQAGGMTTGAVGL